jgi:putative peptidoglycan lipid II flippase
VGIIIGILFFLPSLGVKGLALGVILGALMLVASQVPFVVWEGLFPRLKLLSFEWFRVKRVAIHVIPRTITMSSQQITSLSLVSFASMLGAGSISIFNLAFNLQSVPLSIIGASYSSAAFPVLAKLVAENNKEAFLGKVISAVRHILFWSIPLSILFIVLRAQIVRTVLGSGLFSWSDTKLTAAALALFIISSVGQCLMLLFVRTFYAEGKTAKPLLMNITCTLVTIGLGYGLIKLYFAWPLFADFIQALLKTEGAADSSVLMLPLAFSIGTLLNLIMHWRSFSHEFPAFNKPVFKTAFHSLAASIVGGYVAYFSLRFFDDVFNVETSLGVFLQGLCAGMIGSVVIVLILYLFKSSELRDIAKTLKEKVWRVDESSLDQVPQ